MRERELRTLPRFGYFCCGLLTGYRVQMTKVHPNANALVVNAVAEGEKDATTLVGGETEVLTVWRKSLLFNGNGFTVFDGKGNLVFRVDNYASENKGEIVLMDAGGKPLLTIRRKVHLSHITPFHYAYLCIAAFRFFFFCFYYKVKCLQKKIC